jgi:DedD protein
VNDILKQRLVGALILLALGVVFWPIIFVGPDAERVAEQQSIPLPPGVSTSAIEAPDQEGLRASPERVVDGDSPVVAGPFAIDQPFVEVTEEDAVTAPLSPQAETTVPVTNSPAGEVRSQAPERLAMDTDGVPVAWTLQVATVSSAEKAEELHKRLLALNHKAYTTRVSSGGKSLYRICIGPKFERVELEKLQARINAEFGVTSMVARYTP